MFPRGGSEKPDAEAQSYDTNQTYDSSSAIEARNSRFYQPANPAPLGLCAFALTTFVLSLINIQARDVKTPNIVVGLGKLVIHMYLIVALAYGGLAQFAAGMWEFASGNTFGAVAFTSYGSFWISFGAIFIPFFHIAAAYTSEVEFTNAIGHYLTGSTCLFHYLTKGWAIFTGLMTIGTVRTSLANFTLFFVLMIAFILLASGYYRGANEGLIKAGGWFGLGAAFLAWYNAMSQIWKIGNSFVMLPVIRFPWAEGRRGH